MRILPAIDLINNKIVRLKQGSFDDKTVYYYNALEFAKHLEDNGFEFLHLVDLEGAKERSPRHFNVLESIAKETDLKIDYSGGLSNMDQIKRAFELGATQIAIGSLAITLPDLVYETIELFGNERIILSADCRNNKIATHGWQRSTQTGIIEFLNQFETKKIKWVTCTDISKDGMMEGPSFDLYKQINTSTDINLIASGGIRSLTDISNLKQIGCKACIVGKAIYENSISLKELAQLC